MDKEDHPESDREDQLGPHSSGFPRGVAGNQRCSGTDLFHTLWTRRPNSSPIHNRPTQREWTGPRKWTRRDQPVRTKHQGLRHRIFSSKLIPAKDDKRHTEVAHLDQLIKFNNVRTDIGLASIVNGIKFKNQTFHDNITIRKMIRLDDCDINDVFLVDSYITGPQKLDLYGIRYPRIEGPRTSQQPEFKTQGFPPNLLTSPKLPYLSFPQGMYSTAGVEIPRQPQIRAGVCGSL